MIRPLLYLLAGLLMAPALALSSVVAHSLVFHSHGRRLAHSNVWRDLKAAARRAGVADATLHDLRAMAATEADRQGLSARVLLGHRSDRTTTIYLRGRTVPVATPPRMRTK